MKKLLTLIVTAILAVGCCFGMTACGEKKDEIKVGLITLHDSNSTYDKNFIDAFNAAAEAQGVKAVIKTGVDESEDCYTAAGELAEGGCKLIFADSFGHESYIIKAAKEYTDVEFSHATGTSAKKENLSNFHNAFASIYEGRYLAGVAAGMKLVAMYNADKTIAKDGVIKVGYVGAYAYAEVKSGYTSWFLGVRNTFNEYITDGTKVEMNVTFTNSWYDETKEKNAATSLIDGGCVLISQHADSWGAPTACETKNVPNVSYNGSTETKCPNTFIVSSRINWQPYFEYIFSCVKNGKKIDTDWVGGLTDNVHSGSVELSAFGKTATAEGTETKVKDVAKKLKEGTLKVFDTSKFTVTSYAGGDYAELTEVSIENGVLKSAKQNGTEVVKTANSITYFDESAVDTNRSAPYFDIDIDGITNLGVQE